MTDDKAKKQADKARRAQLRAFFVQALTLVAFAGGKKERWIALADQFPAMEALVREQAEAA
jgi:hypothetical protein